MTPRRTDLVVLIVLVTLALTPLTHLDPWILIPIFPLLVTGLAGEPSISSRALSAGWVVYLGDMSFSIYLLHGFVLEAAKPVLHHFGLGHVFVAWLVTVLPASIAISAVSYGWFERRSRKKIRMWLDPQDRPESPVAAASF